MQNNNIYGFKYDVGDMIWITVDNGYNGPGKILQTFNGHIMGRGFTDDLCQKRFKVKLPVNIKIIKIIFNGYCYDPEDYNTNDNETDIIVVSYDQIEHLTDENKCKRGCSGLTHKIDLSDIKNRE